MSNDEYNNIGRTGKQGKVAVDIFYLSVGLAAAIVFFVFTHREINWDFTKSLDIWLTYIDQNGLLATLRDRISNYTAPYVVYLAVFVGFMGDASPLWTLKVSSLFLHITLALSSALMLYKVAGISAPRPGLTALFMLIAPTSLVNSIAWGQCDALFTTFVVIAFFMLIRDRFIWAIVFFCIAISIKLLAILFLPFLLFHLATRRAFAQMVMILPLLPIIYCVMNVPYLLAGLSIAEVLLIYKDQAGDFHKLAMNAPNPWFILERLGPGIAFSERYYDTLVLAGVALAGALGFGVAALGLRKNIRLGLTESLLLMTLIALAFASVLPKMHDRYFFLADTFALILAITHLRFLLAAALVQVGSLFAYIPFLPMLRVHMPLPLHYGPALGAICMALAFILLMYQAWKMGLIRRLFRSASDAERA